jgi:hypothetical protein
VADVSAIQDVRAELVGKLVAAGLAATDDPRTVPPCVLVGVPTFETPAGIGGWSGTFPVWIVSPPPDTNDGLVWRLDALETVYRTLGFAPAFVDRWGDRDAPAYHLLYPRTVTNPDC